MLFRFLLVSFSCASAVPLRLSVGCDARVALLLASMPGRHASACDAVKMCRSKRDVFRPTSLFFGCSFLLFVWFLPVTGYSQALPTIQHAIENGRHLGVELAPVRQ